MSRAQWRTALMRPPTSYFRLAFVSILVAAGMLLTVAEPVSAGLTPQTLDCTSSVSFGLVQATTAGCSLNQVSSTQYTSSATVTINGIPFPPVPGTNLTLNLPSTASPGGSISIDLQNPISAAGINWVPAGTRFTWNLPAGGPGTEQTVVTTGALIGDSLFGFPIRGVADIRIGCTTGAGSLCYFKFTANLELPGVFKNGPTQNAGGLTAKVGLQVDKNGVHADGVQLVVSNAYIGTLQVKNLCLSYIAAGSTSATPCTPPPYQGESQFLTCANAGNVNRWDGAANVVLPTASRPQVGVYAGVQNNMFSYAGLQVSGLGNSVPIAQGIYLGNFALALCLTPPPLKFKGGAGINIGPTVNGKAPVSIDGDISYTDSTPWVLEATGRASVEGTQVADGFLRYTSTGTIDFGFKANFDFSVVKLMGGVAGWVQGGSPVKFNVDGNGSICLSTIACSSGEVTVSNNGLAGCFTLLNFSYPVIVQDSDWAWYAPWRLHIETRTKRVRAGAGYYWPTKTVSLMGDSCDVGPYRVLRPMLTTQRPAGALDEEGIPVVVSPRTPALSVQVTGTEGAPRVQLVGPGDHVFIEPTTGDEIRRGVVFASDPARRTVAVEIADPAPGTWEVQPVDAPMSTIAGVQVASVAEPPTIVAAVGGNGVQDSLGYAYQAAPGYTITFYEVEPYTYGSAVSGNPEVSDYEQELGVANGTPCEDDSGMSPVPLCGRIAFTPYETPEGGEHHIIALVTNNDTGETVDVINVTQYTPPAEVEPSAVSGLVASRSGGNVDITWDASIAPQNESLPVAYNVAVDLGSTPCGPAPACGEELLDVVPATSSLNYSIVIPGVERGTPAHISVTPMRADDTEGASSLVVLAGGETSTPVPPPTTTTTTSPAATTTVPAATTTVPLATTTTPSSTSATATEG